MATFCTSKPEAKAAAMAALAKRLGCALQWTEYHGKYRLGLYRVTRGGQNVEPK